MNFKNIAFAAAAATIVAGLGAPTPSVAGVTLKAASCFPKGTYFSRRFESFIDYVNKEGRIKLNYVGGAPAIGSPFELVQKTAKGIYDVVNCTGSYYQNVLPEADALKMTERSPEELRKIGAIDFLNKLHAKKNLYYLARIVTYTPFHLYLNKKITKPDLHGLHLRVAPIYTPFFRALGATTQRSNIAQIYTYMENGTVDGYGWPITGLLPDWYKVTKYRVDPGFYDADIQILVNLKSWKGLSAGDRDYLQKVGLIFEAKAVEEKEAVKRAKADQAAKGIQAIVFTGKDREKWVRTAREAGWAQIIKRSPKYGPKLRAYFAVE